MKKVIAPALLALSIAISAHAQQNAADHNAHQNLAAPAASAMSEGVVRKIDIDAKKITLRHGPIANLGMPPMTMVFQVDEPTLLDKVSAGDKVKFHAEKSGGAFVVRQLEKMP